MIRIGRRRRLLGPHANSSWAFVGNHFGWALWLGPSYVMHFRRHDR